MLFSNQRSHAISLPAVDEDGSPTTIANLIGHLCENVMDDSRKDLFTLDSHLYVLPVVLPATSPTPLRSGAPSPALHATSSSAASPLRHPTVPAVLRTYVQSLPLSRLASLSHCLAWPRSSRYTHSPNSQLQVPASPSAGHTGSYVEPTPPRLPSPQHSLLSFSGSHTPHQMCPTRVCVCPVVQRLMRWRQSSGNPSSDQRRRLGTRRRGGLRNPER
jgi:hypothetical protein